MIACCAGVGLHARMVMDLTILMNMLRDAFTVHMGQARRMIVVGQAIGDSVAAGQRKGKRRRQHTEQISQGDDPPRPQPLCPGQTDKHPCVSALDDVLRSDSES